MDLTSSFSKLKVLGSVMKTVYPALTGQGHPATASCSLLVPA